MWYLWKKRSKRWKESKNWLSTLLSNLSESKLTWTKVKFMDKTHDQPDWPFSHFWFCLATNIGKDFISFNNRRSKQGYLFWRFWWAIRAWFTRDALLEYLLANQCALTTSRCIAKSISIKLFNKIDRIDPAIEIPLWVNFNDVKGKSCSRFLNPIFILVISVGSLLNLSTY